MSWPRLAFVAAMPLFLAALAVAQSNRPFSIASPTLTAPVIDGKLDDPCWQEAPALSNFTQVLPVEGAPPSERTEIKFVYTPDQLYVGVRCFDSDPHGIIAKQMKRDGSFTSDDVVQLAFDTFARERDGYSFVVNPAGARRDALFGKSIDENSNWDALWQAKARVDEQGWTVEIALPFKSLSFDPLAASWRCNVERIIRRKQETVRWTALSRAKSFTALEDFGELRGLRGLRQGRGLEVRPYVRGNSHDDAMTGERGFDFAAGFDVTYRLTPTLTAVGTYNTDFAETEIDERIVNLTRFPVSLPEKRDFFLQDAPLFGFGSLPENNQPYYSRRIGIGVDGMPADVLGGGRLTGRIGGTSVALLDVYQEAHAGIAAKNLAVARVSRQMFAESSLGGIVTLGDPQSNGNAWLGGLDFSYQNSRLRNGRVFSCDTFFMFSDTDRVGGSDTAFGLELTYPNEPLNLHGFIRQWGEKFEPALGFIGRTGIRQYNFSPAYVWHPNTSRLRDVSLSMRANVTTDLGNRLVAGDYNVPTMTLTTPAGDQLVLEYTSTLDVLDEPFEIRPGILIPPGSYHYGQFMPSFSTSVARPVSAQFSLRTGDFYSGHRTDLSVSVLWRPSRYFGTQATYERRNIDLHEGSFTVDLASMRLTLAISPDLMWLNMLQYDNLSELVSANSRIRWTWQPGNDVFFVVNQGWDYDKVRFVRSSRDVVLKIGATYRF